MISLGCGLAILGLYLPVPEGEAHPLCWIGLVLCCVALPVEIALFRSEKRTTPARHYEMIVDDMEYEDDMRAINLDDGDWKDQLKRHLDIH